MKNNIFLISIASLVLSGCSSGTENSFEKLTKIVTNLSSYSAEVDEWNDYGTNLKKNGIKYEDANSSDQKFVQNKMQSEYANAINHVGSAFTITEESKEELAKENQGYRFIYNKIITVKDISKNTTIGYCVNYDSERIIDGQVKSEDKDKKNFIYIDKNRPLSIFTGSSDFIKVVCGDDFYKKYKGKDVD
ncbi:hypothetical protein QSH14_01930 [Proteus faecis]|uniref:Lipoprotein n=1 Tax=Proteus faecis TaxID=2050967 RepID=A0AAW7CGP1_9GAMM|nr:hypothetical protein [Proteus faecis]MDL5165847.1 hypothetical protein [Proteus faecis]MDL5273889.1 hypothetical protein [Proteus faecis]MDL5277459.1 hypothetical protein [Proteus faecis]MDL5306448.1 hypothetical protein [Proteus faecis]MDL5310016.1 hypothetical protein [Proteus faecis]